jgi:hypothetical protein
MRVPNSKCTPEVELDDNHGLNRSQIGIASRIVDERRDDFLNDLQAKRLGRGSAG